MSIRSWHRGKLVLLWAWGAVAMTPMLADVLSEPVRRAPIRHSVELLLIVAVLLSLTGLTWHWLGGKE